VLDGGVVLNEGPGRAVEVWVRDLDEDGEGTEGSGKDVEMRVGKLGVVNGLELPPTGRAAMMVNAGLGTAATAGGAVGGAAGFAPGYMCHCMITEGQWMGIL
jgi:hypothetical protein